jgi:hypothetical protein
VEAGTPCTISAGNDGANGIFDTSGAADALGAISVGSIENLANNPASIGGSMSTFSSWSPTNEMYIKPEVSAPGGKILSTYLDGGYAIFSGTSMAAPYVAGVVILIKQVRGTISPAEISHLLSTTAKPLYFNDGEGTAGFLAPVIQQGGGMVNAFAAAHYTSTLDLSNIALNDTVYFKPKHSFTITNTGLTPVTYDISSQAAGTAYTFRVDTVSVPIPDTFPPEFNLNANAAIRFKPSTITIPAKSSGVINAHFTRPGGLTEYRIPIYSGYISINGSNGESLHLPYAGAIGSLKDIPLASGSWGAFLIDTNYGDVKPNTTFVLAGPNSTYVITRAPQISMVWAMGTALLRIEIVPQNTTNLPEIVGRPALGSMSGYPYEYAYRQQLIQSVWDGRLSTGEFVPAGSYKFLVRALRIFGDRTDQRDYETWESIFFNIQYAE